MTPHSKWTLGVIRAPILAVGLFVGLLGNTSCGRREGPPNWPRIGDANQGAIAIGRSGCGSCHIIPGIQHADGLVGPPLLHFSERTIIAGTLANTPSNLVQWVQHPQKFAPGNAMPDGNLTDQEARDIAAYLLTLR